MSDNYSTDKILSFLFNLNQEQRVSFVEDFLLRVPSFEEIKRIQALVRQRREVVEVEQYDLIQLQKSSRRELLRRTINGRRYFYVRWNHSEASQRDKYIAAIIFDQGYRYRLTSKNNFSIKIAFQVLSVKISNLIDRIEDIGTSVSKEDSLTIWVQPLNPLTLERETDENGKIKPVEVYLYPRCLKTFSPKVWDIEKLDGGMMNPEEWIEDEE